MTLIECIANIFDLKSSCFFSLLNNPFSLLNSKSPSRKPRVDDKPVDRIDKERRGAHSEIEVCEIRLHGSALQMRAERVMGAHISNQVVRVTFEDSYLRQCCSARLQS